jgi:ribonucleoside-diphosphate reductase alpha chain
MRWLASRFLDADTQEELGILTPEVRARKMSEDAVSGASGGSSRPTNGGNGSAVPAVKAEVQPAVAALTDTPPVLPAKLIGLDLGPACNQCGGMMQRTGSCYTCSSCGNNTGCG